LTALSGSPFPLSVSNHIATVGTGAYLYVTTGASVVGYSIDATTGSLSALAGFPVASGANAYSVTVDPSNQFLYIGNEGAASVSGYKLNAADGELTAHTRLTLYCRKPAGLHRNTMKPRQVERKRH
jgi:6-phosphogluconolactonase